MRNFQIVARSFLKKGRHNGIKVLSLGVGLAVGLVLIAKVCFEFSYDNFYPESDCIYQIRANFRIGEKKTENAPTTSMGIAPGMRAEIPGVRSATRLFVLEGENTLLSSDERKYKAEIIVADSSLFDVLPRPVLAGDVKECLSRPMYAMVARSLAEKIGGGTSVNGMTFELAAFPGMPVTIDGVFEDIPVNTHLHYDLIISWPTLEAVMGWTGDEDQWFGGDAYLSYVKLQPGLDAGSMKKPMADMLARHVDPELMKEKGIEYSLSLLPLSAISASSPETLKMALIFVMVAFAIMFAALMNYVLLAVSSVVARARDIAVQKCYGASGKDISGLIFSETFLNLIVSLLVSVFLILAFREFAERLLNTSLTAMFTFKTLLVLVCVFLLIFLIAGLLPSRLFSGIPVAAVFRSYDESRKSWKKVLLFVQFIAVGFLVSLLAVIGLQYNMMITENTGYSYDRLAYCVMDGVDVSTRRVVMEELSKIPAVEEVATGTNLPIGGYSGNMVYRPGTGEVIMHFEDLEGVDAGYFSFMKIPVVQGKAFDSSYADSSRVMMVSKKMAGILARALDWKDGVVGKKLYVSGHDSQDGFEVVGVYDDIRTGHIDHEAASPSAMFYSSAPSRNLMIRLREMTPGTMGEVQDAIQKLLPDQDVSLVSYKMSLTNLYAASRMFRDSVLVGGVVALIITLIGLIGYVNNETYRRGKEIAIRKINGATEKNVLSMIVTDVVCMALPAVVLGTGISWYVGEKWLQQFSEKIPVNAGLFGICSVFVLFVVLGTVVYRSWKVAVSNPVETLRSE